MSEVIKHLNELGKWYLDKKNLKVLTEKYNSLSVEKKKYIDLNYSNFSNDELISWLNGGSEFFKTTSDSKTNDLNSDMVMKKLDEIQKKVNSNNTILIYFFVLSILSFSYSLYLLFRY